MVGYILGEGNGFDDTSHDGVAGVSFKLYSCICVPNVVDFQVSSSRGRPLTEITEQSRRTSESSLDRRCRTRIRIELANAYEDSG